MKIGFIGLGNMGAPMALNLLRAGHALSVFDLSTASVAKLVEAGATAVQSPISIADSDAEVIITMLPAAVHVKSVYQGEGGLLKNARPGVLMIDCSTIDPMTAREISQAASDYGCRMIDAPVSGGTGGATTGNLTFMVGGADSDFEFAQTILKAMGKTIVHCGDSGNGQVTKIANNMLLGITMIGVSEAMALGVGLGVDARVLANVINTSTGRCWSSEVYNPVPGVVDTAPASRGYTGGFGTDLMLKDLGLASEAARQIGQSVIMGGTAQQLYQQFSAQGNGAVDFSAIINSYFRKKA